MLTNKQISEIREHLERAQNPLFFFDNDPDGLCSFLLLRRFIGRGKGVAVKSFPDLNVSYFRKIEELRADYIFILDKPLVSEEFLKQAQENNIPVVWIDHHETEENEQKFKNFPDVFYFNPNFNSGDMRSSEPTTDLCYQVIDANSRKRDLWISVVGCISDMYIPSYYSEIKEEYPELYISTKNAFDVLYKSDVGKLIKILSFGLKDSITNVVLMIKFLLEVKAPSDITEITTKNKAMHKRFDLIHEKYEKFLSKALEIGKILKNKKIIFFQYGGDLSISSDLSNELIYNFPDKLIVVAYIKGIKANISVRGKRARELTLKAIEGLEDATGGGHEEATGAKVRVDDLEIFKKKLEDLMKEMK